MSLTRRQRNLEKLTAVRARKKLQSAQAARQIGGKSDDVSEVKVDDSKLDKTEDLIPLQLPATDEKGETYHENITDSPVSSRADDDEESARKVTTDSPTSSYSEDDQEPAEGLFMPTHDDGEPLVVVDSREDGREVRRSKLHKHLLRYSTDSRGENDKSTDAQIASEGEINSTGTNKASPLRRFDIVEGSFNEKGHGECRSGKGAHKKSSKTKLSEKHRKCRKVRKDHTREDDALSFDSQLEPWMSEGRGNPFASALDRVFDYFDEMRSVGDESYSIRTEKTEETVPVAPRRSAGSFFADVEGIFTEGFNCGSLVAACESLNTPTYSFHEDESTLSGTRGSKEAMDSSASLGTFPKKFEGDTRSEQSSLLPEEGDVYTNTSATIDEYKLPNETKALKRGESTTSRKAVDTQYGAMLRDMCFVPVDCLTVNETPKINGIGDDSLPKKLQQLVQEATDQAANIRNNFNSDVIYDIGQHSLDTYNSSTCPLPIPETGSQSTVIAGESIPASDEKNWTQTFLSSELFQSHLAETASVETQSIAEGQTKVHATGVYNQHRASKREGISEQKGTDDGDYLYAVGQSIKASASFFSLDTKAMPDTPKTALQEAVAKLREIDSAPVTDRIREIGDQVKEVLTCSGNVIPQDSSGLELSTNGQTISISMENMQNMCSCMECHAPGAGSAVQENIVHVDVEQKANVVSLDDTTTEVVTSAMDTGKPLETNDQTRGETDHAEWTPLQEWHDSFQAERYSADAIAGIVCDDENAEPAGIASSTMSAMDGFSSTQTVSSLGIFEDIPLENEVKPRRKWEPISKGPTGSFGRPNGTLTKSTMMSTVTSGQVINDENAPNRKPVIPTAPWLCEQSGPQNGSLLDTCHPFVSTKAKRQAWRNTQADDFVDIMSANARADDWNQIVAGRQL